MGGGKERVGELGRQRSAGGDLEIAHLLHTPVTVPQTPKKEETPQAIWLRGFVLVRPQGFEPRTR